jgi:hypothetical protein
MPLSDPVSAQVYPSTAAELKKGIEFILDPAFTIDP